MSRWAAFLRAINVGGHTVKMDALRRLFEELGLAGVETFIASGNVLFDAPEEDARTLERRVEARLQAALGYAVAAFIRTDAEMQQIAAAEPFSAEETARAAAFNVGFLAEPPEEASVRKLMGLKTEIDHFRVVGREVYWLCRVKQSESSFSNAALEKTLGAKSTLRGMATVQKIAGKTK